MKKKVIFGVIIAVLLLLAGGILLWHFRSANSSDNSRKHEVKPAEVSKPTEATKTEPKAETKAAEEELKAFEQKEPLYKTTARHGFKMGAVISYQNALIISFVVLMAILILGLVLSALLIRLCNMLPF